MCTVTALGFFDIDCEEMMFYQYLPIKLAGQLETTIDAGLGSDPKDVKVWKYWKKKI